MELLVAQTKTEQVTAALRSQIKKGYYKSGSRLAGIRQLANVFNVSTRVVGCALENLQQEKLLRSEHGRGIFVEPWTEHDIISVYMLFWGITERKSNYLDGIVKIAYPPVMPSDFSFTLRALMKNTDEYHHLDAELGRIDNSPDIKCAIFNAAQFNCEHIEKFKQLHCPFIMLGDSSSTNISDLDCNHIAGDNYKEGQHCLEFMNQRGYKEITLLTLNRKPFFYDQFCKGVEDAAKAVNIKVNMLEMAEGIHCTSKTESEIKQEYEQEFYKVPSVFFDVPIIANGLREEIFIKIFSEQNKISNNLPVILPILDSKYLSGFYESIYKMIKKVVKQPHINHKELVDVSFIINDLANNEKYLCKQGDMRKIN